MIGVEKGISIDSLAVGASTEHFEFLLRKPKEGEPIPISYGDYVASYKQREIEKRIFVPTPSMTIVIKINDESFSVE